MKSRVARESDRETVQALLRENGLEADFVAAQFRVIEESGSVVASGRLKPLPEGDVELASVAVVAARRGEGFGDLMTRELVSATGPAVDVYALALAPGFFARHGFVAIDVASLPPSLAGKARGICASQGFIAMLRTPTSGLDAP